MLMSHTHSHSSHGAPTSNRQTDFFAHTHTQVSINLVSVSAFKLRANVCVYVWVLSMCNAVLNANGISVHRQTAFIWAREREDGEGRNRFWAPVFDSILDAVTFGGHKNVNRKQKLTHSRFDWVSILRTIDSNGISFLDDYLFASYRFSEILMILTFRHTFVPMKCEMHFTTLNDGWHITATHFIWFCTNR